MIILNELPLIIVHRLGVDNSSNDPCITVTFSMAGYDLQDLWRILQSNFAGCALKAEG